jgi:hypothetical protein
MGLDKDMEIGSASNARAVIAPCKVGDEVKVHAPGTVPFKATVEAVSDDGRKITVYLPDTEDCQVFYLIGMRYKSPYGDQLFFSPATKE